MDRRRADLARVVLALLGLLISAYLTAVHYDTHVPLACANVGIVDCAGVLTSPQSQWFHIPVALFGLAWCAVAGTLSALCLRAGPTAAGGIRAASLAWVVVGAATVVFLVYDELIVIGRICLWCTSVHVLVLASLALAVL